MAVSAGNGIPDPKSWEAPSDLGRSGRHHISIKTPDSDKLYTKSVSDRILIPVSQDPGKETVTKEVQVFGL